jgi:hypothetical protein
MKKLTLPAIGGLLLSSLLLPSALAANLPEGAVVSGGLAWTRNNSTAVGNGSAAFGLAKQACDNLTQSYTVGACLLRWNYCAVSISKTALTSGSWTLGNTWSATPNPNKVRVPLWSE